MSQLRDRLVKEFTDQEYRHGYADDFLNTAIAAQIKALRDQRGWTQAQLAERAGMRQSRISAMEDINYTSWSVRTLARLAEAFDVALAVCFKSFTERLADIDRFSPGALAVPSYIDDLFLSVGAKAPPKLADTSPLVPLLGNLAQVVAHFSAGAGPDSAPDFQQNAVALMTAVEQMYGNASRQYREFGEWLGGLAAAIGVAAQEKAEHANAKLKEIDEIRRLTEENRALREEVRALRIAAVEAQTQQRIAAIHEAAQREIEGITRLRDALLEVIAGERERIRQLAAATAKSDLSVSQFLREIEESLNRVGEVVHA